MQNKSVSFPLIRDHCPGDIELMSMTLKESLTFSYFSALLFLVFVVCSLSSLVFSLWCSVQPVIDPVFLPLCPLCPPPSSFHAGVFLLHQRWIACPTFLHLVLTTTTITWASPSSNSLSLAARRSRLHPRRCPRCLTLRRHTVDRLAAGSPSFPVCTTRAWCPRPSAPSWSTSSLWWHRSSTSSMRWTGCWRSSPCRSSTSTTHLSTAAPTTSRWSHRWHRTQRCPPRFTNGWGTSWSGLASHKPSLPVWPSTEPRWGGKIQTAGPPLTLNNNKKM